MSTLRGAGTASELLAALRRARPRKAGAWPAFLPDDVERVVRGDKALLALSPATAAAPALAFACTSCGSCCRTLSSSVLLDPADTWTISAQLGGAPLPPSAVRRVLGRFEAAALGAPATASGWTQAAREGLAPVQYLSPSDGGDGDVRCGFAMPACSADGSARSPVALECSLGPAAMPYACSLYPLGDFFTSKSAQFYSLDEAGCEGVGGRAGAAPPPLRTLGEYRDTNALQQRQAAAEWFRRLATGHSCSGLEADTARAGARASTPRLAQQLRAVSAIGGVPWLRPGLDAVEGELQVTGRTWGAVEPVDLLLRLLRDRLRALWYAPAQGGVEGAAQAMGAAVTEVQAARAAGARQPVLPGWAAVEPLVEAATQALHAEWRGLILPALRGPAQVAS